MGLQTKGCGALKIPLAVGYPPPPSYPPVDPSPNPINGDNLDIGFAPGFIGAPVSVMLITTGT